MKKILLLLGLVYGFLPVDAQQRDPHFLAYIEQFYPIAVRQQQKHGIPASIILAQALLESGAGRGRLAVQANNHFGIKCHGWTGATILHDDDERNECFRKYRHAIESFEDHSEFLRTRPRYASLFLLETTDYVGWAHGLRAAGYATDPAYATKLISLIERFELYKFDRMTLQQLPTQQQGSVQNVEVPFVRTFFKSNNISIIVAEPGDTWSGLARELRIREERLRSFNEVDEQNQLTAGSIVYLSRKKRRANRANQIHVVRAGESMYSVSQIYGIQVRSLYELNNMTFDQGAYIHQVLRLR